MKIDKEIMEDSYSISFPCIRLCQPIGEFYCGSISSKDLVSITFADVRRLEGERDFENYLGIQRPLDKKRVKEIAAYVGTADACFPSGVILAVAEKCASFNPETNMMTLSNHISSSPEDENIIRGEIAKVLDGQHRIEGLKEFKGEVFDINVSIFVEIDIAEQAYIFSTVNLAQTKVNKSLVYDLFGLAKSRSPQKLAHKIAVALDVNKGSPLYGMIKRLGSATIGKNRERITQATFVESLLNYFSEDADADRDTYRRGHMPLKASSDELEKFIFRNMMIEEKDMAITDILWNYFEAISEKWPRAWTTNGRGLILNRTNGFKALMRFLRPVYLYLCGPGEVPTKEEFLKILSRVSLQDDDFNIDNFKPGTSGESELYRQLLSSSRLKG